MVSINNDTVFALGCRTRPEPPAGMDRAQLDHPLYTDKLHGTTNEGSHISRSNRYLWRKESLEVKGNGDINT
jgi:hypothetical protein